MSLTEAFEGKSQGDRVVSTKIPREEFTRFQRYCKVNRETINAALKRLILSEIDTPQPSKVAGRSIFEYNRKRDDFVWKVKLDDGTLIEIDNSLPVSSVEQLLDSINKAIDERNTFVRKSKSRSVSLPNKLLRKMK